jgi:NADH-quinone oxidoreductase subunit H
MTLQLFCYYFFNANPSVTATGHIPAEYGWIEYVRILVRVLIGLFAILLAVPPLVWWERRLLGWMQQREGPNRVGPYGLLQTIADGIKLLFKEDMNPLKVDKVLFVLAPVVFLIPSLVVPGVIPWGPSTTWGAVAPDNSIGVLYLLAWSSLAVYGIVMAGWSSNNKYSLLGGLRSSAQMISYELAMGLAVITVVLLSGSLDLREIVEKQGDNILQWNVLMFFPLGFVAFLIYTVSMFAETNRAPFDLPEAETELVAGYHTEYTSMKFATFFMGEYANMIIVSAINATLFLGGYHAFIPQLGGAYLSHMATAAGHPAVGAFLAAMVPVFWFTAKILAGLYFFIWVRATMPRLRYDMLMRFGWQGLLPISLINILLVAIAISLGWAVAAVLWLIVFVVIGVIFTSTKSVKKFANNTRRGRSIELHANAVPYQATAADIGRGGQTAPPGAAPAGEPQASEPVGRG